MVTEKQTENEFQLLSDLVAAHKVCYEVWPEKHLGPNGKICQIGFELTLIGTHYNPEHLPWPGCDECYKVYQDLHNIAVWILPKEKRDSRYEVQIFDSAMRRTPKRKFRSDIELTIKILHREGLEGPVDACEIRCLNEMKTKLRELGVTEGEWRARKK